MAVLLKGGLVVTPGGAKKADIFIQDEKIAALGKLSPDKACDVFDCRGLVLLPGGVETHTHLDLEVMDMHTADDFSSGSRAALAGGTTTVLDFATSFKDETMAKGISNWHRKADGKTYCDFGFHLALVDWNDALEDEMAQTVDEGISSFKFYLAYKGSLMVDDGRLYRAMRRAAEVGAVVGVHCENGDLIATFVDDAVGKGEIAPEFHELCRPAVLEAEAIERFCRIGEMAGARHYVVHLSTKEGFDALMRARARGSDVAIETCAQYLLLDRKLYSEGDFYDKAKVVMSPPLRTASDREALWRGLASGDIDFVGSDHCSFYLHGQKDHGLHDFRLIPNGGPGIELRLPLLYSFGVAKDRLSLERFVDVVSTNAARYFGLYPKKGALAVGSDADIVVLDPTAKWKVRQEDLYEACDYTPYEGLELTGRIVDVYLRGKKVVEDGKVIDDPPSGRYLARSRGEDLR
jgi:dihydropyrimidinase